MAIRIAGEVTVTEARMSGGKDLAVASTAQPATAVHVFASNHSNAQKIRLDIMCELIPDDAASAAETGSRDRR
jgi:hypothetical protein